MSEQQSFAEVFGEPISVYTQEQAIDDGVLVRDPIVDIAREAGFRQPVTFTAALYMACEAAHGDLEAWLWDVLSLGMIRWKVEGVRLGARGELSPESVGPISYTLKIGTRVRTVWLSWNTTEAFVFLFPEDY